MKKKKHKVGKPHGMNLAQTKQYERQQFNAIVDQVAQVKLNDRSEKLQQQVIDAAFFAANDMFHLGPTRCKPFGELILKYLHEIAELINTDAEDDPEVIYAKAKIDQRMQQICGENFDPWDVRYNGAKNPQKEDANNENKEADG